MRRLLVAAVAAAALVLVGQAGAVTRTLYAGENTPPPAGAEGGTFNDFFPHTLKVHRGDKVKVLNFGFHTATFLGGRPYGDYFLITPDTTGGTYADTQDDAAGQPFYFESLPKLLYNPLALAPTQNTALRKKTTFASSGLALVPQTQDQPGSFTFSFPKNGTFTIVCLIHPNMKGKVIVTGPRANIPSPAQQRATARAQIAAGWQEAIELKQTQVPQRTAFGATSPTVFAGVGDKVTLLRFLPDEVSLPVGETLTLKDMSPQEPHNIITGPPDYIGQFMTATDLIPFEPGAPNQFSPIFPYGTDPAVGGFYTYVGPGSHGNGFFATPLMDMDPASPFADTQQIRFTTPGVYHFFCALHGPDMSLTVNVTAAVG